MDQKLFTSAAISIFTFSDLEFVLSFSCPAFSAFPSKGLNPSSSNQCWIVAQELASHVKHSGETPAQNTGMVGKTAIFNQYLTIPRK